MSGVSLHAVIERPISEAVKVKPGILEDPKMLEMPEQWLSAKESANRERKQPKRRKSAAVTKASRTGRS